jgi:hypothetical protein
MLFFNSVSLKEPYQEKTFLALHPKRMFYKENPLIIFGLAWFCGFIYTVLAHFSEFPRGFSAAF